MDHSQKSCEAWLADEQIKHRFDCASRGHGRDHVRQCDIRAISSEQMWSALITLSFRILPRRFQLIADIGDLVQLAVIEVLKMSSDDVSQLTSSSTNSQCEAFKYRGPSSSALNLGGESKIWSASL